VRSAKGSAVRDHALPLKRHRSAWPLALPSSRASAQTSFGPVPARSTTENAPSGTAVDQRRPSQCAMSEPAAHTSSAALPQNASAPSGRPSSLLKAVPSKRSSAPRPAAKRCSRSAPQSAVRAAEVPVETRVHSLPSKRSASPCAPTAKTSLPSAAAQIAASALPCGIGRSQHQ
jgi:hypothetical protein